MSPINSVEGERPTKILTYTQYKKTYFPNTPKEPEPDPFNPDDYALAMAERALKILRGFLDKSDPNIPTLD